MGAAAWGDGDRLSNRYYVGLREIVHLGPHGERAPQPGAGELDAGWRRRAIHEVS